MFIQVSISKICINRKYLCNFYVTTCTSIYSKKTPKTQTVLEINRALLKLTALKYCDMYAVGLRRRRYFVTARQATEEEGVTREPLTSQQCQGSVSYSVSFQVI
jgi:hypothetical protein